MSNSSSFSSYSRFSSSSSKPGAYAAQFSTIGVTHVWIRPNELVDRMSGLKGCHWLGEWERGGWGRSQSGENTEEKTSERRGPETHVEVLEGVFRTFENL